MFIWLTQPVKSHVVITTEIMVKIIAIAPIVLAVLAFCLKYFTPGQRPSGGRKILVA